MKDEINQRLLNSVKEYSRFVDSLIKEGLVFEKKVTKFSRTSAAIYLPKRLIGKKFKVFLMPIDDPYEVEEAGVTDKQADKILREAEKDLEKIQSERKPLEGL